MITSGHMTAHCILSTHSHTITQTAPQGSAPHYVIVCQAVCANVVLPGSHWDILRILTLMVCTSLNEAGSWITSGVKTQRGTTLVKIASECCQINQNITQFIFKYRQTILLLSISLRTCQTNVIWIAKVYSFRKIKVETVNVKPVI